MIVRRAVAVVMLATLGAACSNAKREKAVADSLAAIAAAADSVRLAAAVADSVRLAAVADSARRDSIAKASVKRTGPTGATGSKTKTATKATKIIGRDSVRLGPIGRLPIDTPRKPR